MSDAIDNSQLQATIDAVSAVTEAYRAIAGAFATATTAWVTLIRPDVSFWFMATDDQEEAARAYATWYNAWHPGHRVSWRRLNRVQLAQAGQRWMEWHAHS